MDASVEEEVPEREKPDPAKSGVRGSALVGGEGLPYRGWMSQLPAVIARRHHRTHRPFPMSARAC